MKVLDKIQALLSPLDVVSIEKTFEKLIARGANPDIPEECLNFATDVLSRGEYADRNPTRWCAFKDEEVELGSKKWNDGISNILRLTSSYDVKEIDNQHDYLLVTIKLDILAINTRDMPNTILKGAKCVLAKTAFGVFPIEE